MDTIVREADDLFFDTLVHSYVQANPRFLRRDWLARELDERLREPGKRFVLLTAEPGAGKSAFLAQLAHDHPDWLRYFIRRDQRSVLADVSDKSLLLRIGYQLAAQHPELFTPEQLRLSVVQKIGEVAEQGEAVGAEVKRLTASPFYQKVLEIEQQVRTNQGKVVGLRVEELVIETRLLPAEDLLHLALIHPARALKRTDPTQKVVILVDALDEIRYHPTAENILVWLTNCPAQPENIRFVLTSRPPDEALSLFRTKQAADLAELTIAEDDAHVKRDIEQFVTSLVEEPALADPLAQTKGGAEAFAKKAVDKAHGNLGYLDALARGIDQALAEVPAKDEPTRLRGRSTLDALLSLTELPADLEGLYAFFLHQIKSSVARERIELKDPESGETYDKPAWPTVYDRILGVLAVAMEPLDLDLLLRLGGIRAERVWVSGALDRLRQFLDIADGRYRLYHATVAEFLTAERTLNSFETRDLYHDRQSCHRVVANHFWRDRDKWAQIATYGLQHLAVHLSCAGRTAELLALGDKWWFEAKMARFGSASSVLEDLDVGIRHLRVLSPIDLGELVPLSALYADLIAAGPPYAVEVLARGGQISRARAMAENISFAVDRCLAFALLSGVHWANGDPKGTAQLVTEARRAIPAIDPAHRPMALYWIVETMVSMGDLSSAREAAQEALRSARGVNDDETPEKATALFWTAMSFRHLDDQEQLGTVSADISHLRLTPIWNQYMQTKSIARDYDALDEVFRHFTSEPSLQDPASLRNLCNLSLALADARMDSQCDVVLDLIRSKTAAGEYAWRSVVADASKRYAWALGLRRRFEQAFDHLPNIENGSRDDGTLDLEEERAKALCSVLDVALERQRAGLDDNRAIQRGLQEVERMAGSTNWCVLARLARVLAKAGRLDRALQLAERVRDFNVTPSLANTLTLPRRAGNRPPPKSGIGPGGRSQKARTSAGRIKWVKGAKTARLSLRTNIAPVEDEFRADRAIASADAGRWTEAEAMLESIRIPSCRTRALASMAKHAADIDQARRLWSEAIVEARLAGKEHLAQTLTAGAESCSEVIAPLTWKQLLVKVDAVASWWR